MTDTLKAAFTYGVAAFVVVAGGWGIYNSRADPGAADTVAILAGFVGSALTFLFSQEVQTRTARQSNTASAAGAAQAHGGATNGSNSTEV
jgi:hypothetical protein